MIAYLGNIFNIVPLGANAANLSEGHGLIRYLEAYKNTDVEQERLPNKLKESLVLKKPGHPEEFSYKIATEKYDWQKDPKGNFVFYKKGNKGDPLSKIFTIEAPYLIDAEGKKSSLAEVEARLDEKGILTLRPNPTWLKNHKYPIVLDPTVEINILNVYSHPAQGEEWVVEFTTQGQADLKIIPADQATIDDDEFAGLYCGETKVEPQILAGDVIFYKDWECTKTAKVIHYTLKAGKHKLIFDFGGAAKEAFNDDWWDNSWIRRKAISVGEKSGGNLTNYPVKLTVSYDSDMVDIFTDLRFTNGAGTPLDYWVETVATSTSATVWVEVDSLTASATSTIYMYYGNSGAANGESGDGTFTLFDDFENYNVGDAPSESKFITSGVAGSSTINIQLDPANSTNKILKIYEPSDGVYTRLTSVDFTPGYYAVHMRIRFSASIVYFGTFSVADA